jgi:hypothetical protein
MLKNFSVLIVGLLTFICCYIVFPNSGYEPVNIKVSSEISKYNSKEKVLHVINNDKDLSGTRYNILKKNYKFTVFDDPIYGLCFLKDISLSEVIINKTAYNQTDFIKNQDGCVYRTPLGLANKKTSNFFLTVTHILSCTIVTAFMVLIYWLIFIYGIYEKENKQYIASLVISIFLVSLIFLTVYPALYDIDFLNTLIATKMFYSDAWFTYLNNVIAMALINIYESPRIFPLASSIIFVGILGLFLKVLDELFILKKWKYYIFGLLFLPSFWFHLSHVSRDIAGNLFSILLCVSFILILVWQLKYKAYNPHFLDYSMMFFVVFCMSIRTDFLPLGTVFMLSYMVFRRISNVNKAKVGVFFIMVLALSIVLRNKMTPGYPYSKKVKVIASLSQPLGFILRQNYKTDSKERDLELIDQYLDTNLLLERYSDNDIMAFHGGALRKKWKTNLDDLYSVSFKIFKDNFSLFLENRFKMFYYLLGSTYETYFPAWEHSNWDVPFDTIHKMNENKMHLYDSPPIPVLTSFAMSIYKLLYQKNPLKYSFFTFPAVLLMLLSIIMFIKTPISAIISLMVTARLPIMFLLVPAAQHKYIFDIFVIGFFLLPLFIWELKTKESQALFQNLSFLKALKRKSIK